MSRAAEIEEVPFASLFVSLRGSLILTVSKTIDNWHKISSGGFMISRRATVLLMPLLSTGGRETPWFIDFAYP